MGGGSYGGHPGGDFGLGGGGMRDLGGLSEVDFEEILNKNKTLAHNTINRAMDDATQGNETYLTNVDNYYHGSYSKCLPSNVVPGSMAGCAPPPYSSFPCNLSPIFLSPMPTPTLSPPCFEFFTPIGLDYSNGMWPGVGLASLKI